MSGFLHSLKSITGGKHGQDTRMRFSVAPLPGDSTFTQWHDAMMMCARLPGGIPQEFRRRLWLTLSEKHLQARGVDWSHAQRFCFNEWSNPDDDELGDQIVKDLHRTGCSLFCGEEAEDNQAMLKRVLLAYARWNKGVGYCQGFNMLAAIILEVMERQESDALKVMIYLIEGVLPESYFANNLRGLSVDMAVFRDLLRLRLPHLSRHLEHLQQDAADLATGACYEPPLTNVFTMQWFLTLFSNCLPRETVMRVWDLTFLQGNEVLLRTALAIWDGLAVRILEVHSADEFYTVMGVLTREMLTFGLVDANKLVQTVVGMAPFPFPGLADLRDKYTYNITPWTQSVSSVAKRGLRLFYSDDDEDEEEDEDNDEDDQTIAVATAFGLSGIFRKSIESGRGPSPVSGSAVSPSAFPSMGYPSPRHTHEAPRENSSRPNLDISALKKQYARLRERQKQAHIILTSSQIRVGGGGMGGGGGQRVTPLTMNHLLRGKKALTSKTRRVVPKGVIPVIKPKKKAERKLSETGTRSTTQPSCARQPLKVTPSSSGGVPTTHQTLKRLSSNTEGPPKVAETLHWKDTPRRDRRASLPSGVKLLEAPTFSSGKLGVPEEMDDDDDDGGSSTSTELCDDDEDDKISDLEPDVVGEPRPATTSPRLETVVDKDKSNTEEKEPIQIERESVTKDEIIKPSVTELPVHLETQVHDSVDVVPETNHSDVPLSNITKDEIVKTPEILVKETQEMKENENVSESKDPSVWTFPTETETQTTFGIPIEDLLAGKSLTAAEIIARIPFPSDVSFMKESQDPVSVQSNSESLEITSSDPFSSLHNVTPEKSPVDSPSPQFPSPIPEKESSLIVGASPNTSPVRSLSRSHSPSPKGSPFISPEKSPSKSPSLSPTLAYGPSNSPIWSLTKLPPMNQGDTTQDLYYTPPKSPKITLQDEKSNVFEIHSGFVPLEQTLGIITKSESISPENKKDSPTEIIYEIHEVYTPNLSSSLGTTETTCTISEVTFSETKKEKDITESSQRTITQSENSCPEDLDRVTQTSESVSSPFISTSRFSSLISELQEKKVTEEKTNETFIKTTIKKDSSKLHKELLSDASLIVDVPCATTPTIVNTDSWLSSLTLTTDSTSISVTAQASKTPSTFSPENTVTDSTKVPPVAIQDSDEHSSISKNIFNSSTKSVDISNESLSSIAPSDNLTNTEIITKTDVLNESTSSLASSDNFTNTITTKNDDVSNDSTSQLPSSDTFITTAIATKSDCETKILSLSLYSDSVTKLTAESNSDVSPASPDDIEGMTDSKDDSRGTVLSLDKELKQATNLTETIPLWTNYLGKSTDMKSPDVLENSKEPLLKTTETTSANNIDNEAVNTNLEKRSLAFLESEHFTSLGMNEENTQDSSISAVSSVNPSVSTGSIDRKPEMELESASASDPFPETLSAHSIAFEIQTNPTTVLSFPSDEVKSNTSSFTNAVSDSKSVEDQILSGRKTTTEEMTETVTKSIDDINNSVPNTSKFFSNITEPLSSELDEVRTIQFDASSAYSSSKILESIPNQDHSSHSKGIDEMVTMTEFIKTSIVDTENQEFDKMKTTGKVEEIFSINKNSSLKEEDILPTGNIQDSSSLEISKLATNLTSPSSIEKIENMPSDKTLFSEAVRLSSLDIAETLTLSKTKSIISETEEHLSVDTSTHDMTSDSKDLKDFHSPSRNSDSELNKIVNEGISSDSKQLNELPSPNSDNDSVFTSNDDACNSKDQDISPDAMKKNIDILNSGLCLTPLASKILASLSTEQEDEQVALNRIAEDRTPSPLKNGKKSPSMDASFGRPLPVIASRDGESLSTSIEGRLSSLSISASRELDDNESKGACSQEEKDTDKTLEESETDLFNGKDLSSEAIRQRLWRGVKSLSLDADVTLDPDIFCFLIQQCSRTTGKSDGGKKLMGLRRNSEVELQQLVKENTEIIEKILKQKSLEDSPIYCIKEGDIIFKDSLELAASSDNSNSTRKCSLKSPSISTEHSQSPTKDQLASIQLSRAVSNELGAGTINSDNEKELLTLGGIASSQTTSRCSLSSSNEQRLSHIDSDNEINVKSCGITKSFTKPSKLSRSSSVTLDKPKRPITFNPFPTRNLNKPPKDVAVKLGLYSPNKTSSSSPS